jgi:D-Tyr-tRNAtyr deacylase
MRAVIQRVRSASVKVGDEEVAAIGRVRSGRFGAMMSVSLENDGPVTLWLDTRQRE